MKTKQCMLTGMLVLLAALAIAVPAAAWPTGYDYDGYPLLTNESATLKGSVYVSAGNNSGLTSSPYVVGYSSIPAGTVKWAHLYTGVWGGTEDHVGWANITVTNATGTYTLGNETLNKSSMSSSTSCSGNGKWLVCKDVTKYLDGSTLSATARTGNIAGGFDGRVYSIVLAAAIESASGNKTAYWVNVGNLNLHYDAGQGELNSNLTWMNGTAYASNEAKVYAMQYVGSVNEPDFLYFNAPFAGDSPSNLTNIAWNITRYRTYQLDGNNVADCSEGSYFDLDTFTVSNDTTALKNIVNQAGNNHMVFWRGHDSDGDGVIGGSWMGTAYEGEVYVSPMVAALVLKDITRVYDFSNTTPGTAGTDLLAYKGEVNMLKPTGNDVPTGSVTYPNIDADDDVDREFFETSTDGAHAAQRFIFGIDESAGSIDGLTATWNGMGYHDGGSAYNGTYLYIWDANAGSYQELANTTSGSETTLSGGVTSNIGNYISSGNVTVLGVQKSASDGMTTSTIRTDYVKLVVDPKVG